MDIGKLIGRNTSVTSIDFFSYKGHNGYICTGDAWFGYCLPYNDETAHLLGTTDDWKGGEE